MRVCGLVRVSTPGQAENGYGLVDQEASIRAHCLKRGHELVELVQDAGVTGQRADRPGVVRTLALAGAGSIEGVVLPRVDRVGRRSHVIHGLLHEFRSRGLRVEFSDQDLDDSPSGKLLLSTLAGISEYQLEDIRVKTMNGRRDKARETGRSPTASVPFGYRAVSKAQSLALPEFKNRDGELLVEPAEAQIVRGLFERAAAGASLRSLTDWAKDQGIPRSRSGIHRILQNEAYLGRPTYAGVTLTCPALVSEEVFARANERLAHNREALRGRPSDRFPLRGTVYCGVCRTQSGAPKACRGRGGRATGAKRKYACGSEQAGKEAYCHTWHYADDLEELARLELEEAATPGRLAQSERERVTRAARDAGDPQHRAAAARATLEALVGEELSLSKKYDLGMSDQVFQIQTKDIADRRRQAEADLSAAQRQVSSLESPEAAAARGEAMAARLREALQDPEQFSAWARRLLTITLFKDREPVIEVRMPPGAEVAP